MNADTLGFRGASSISVVALALLVASCAKPMYTIGGSVSGLSGNGLVLQNNGGDNLSVGADGAFTFSRQVKKGGGYSVTVFAEPSGRQCTVAGGSGTATSDVTSVAVNCGGLTVGGTVSGLAPLLDHGVHGRVRAVPTTMDRYSIYHGISSKTPSEQC